MKKSNVKFGFLGGLAAALAFTGIAFAADLLPNISKVCENKNGQLLAMADGYSTVSTCPRGYRVAYIIGEKGDQGIQGPQGLAGQDGVDGQGLDLTKIYSKIDGPFNVTVNTSSTVAHGCNSGDLAIGGGLHYYSGNLANWRTIKSLPAMTEPSDVTVTANGWSTTVVNTVENGTFYTLTRCVDLQ